MLSNWNRALELKEEQISLQVVSTETCQPDFRGSDLLSIATPTSPGPPPAERTGGIGDSRPPSFQWAPELNTVSQYTPCSTSTTWKYFKYKYFKDVCQYTDADCVTTYLCVCQCCRSAGVRGQICRSIAQRRERDRKRARWAHQKLLWHVATVGSSDRSDWLLSLQGGIWMATPTTSRLSRMGRGQRVEVTARQPSRAANWRRPVSAPLRKIQEEGGTHN